MAPVVAGIVSLNDFQLKPQSVLRAETEPGQVTFGNGAHGLAPADYAVIYNINPALQSGINGSGSSIGVVGRTNINIADVNDFRSLFGLPSNPPQIIVNGVDPGNVGGGEELEEVLDVYMRPYDPRRPQVCLDETSVQSVREKRIPVAMARGRPVRFDYHLTQAGHELRPVLLSLMQWGDRWAVDAPSVEFTHSCGGQLDLVHTCRACGDEVTGFDLKARILTPAAA